MRGNYHSMRTLVRRQLKRGVVQVDGREIPGYSVDFFLRGQGGNLLLRTLHVQQ